MLGAKSTHAQECFEGNCIGADCDIREDLTGHLPEEWRVFNREFIPKFLVIRPDKTRIAAGLAGGARNLGCEAYRVGGVADHMHLAVRLSRTVTIAALMEELKTTSSKWVKTQSPDLSTFAWQRGYGAFSVGPADRDALTAYIGDQENHHRKRTFQEEFRMCLKKYGIGYDEAYVWD